MSARPVISASGRKTVVAAFASLALIAASAAPSAAASNAPAPKAAVAGQAVSDATDFSAAKRRYYRRGPNGAGLAVMGAAAGIIGGAIIASQRRDYYEDRYYYDRGPAYAPGGPYYGGNAYYGGGGYRQPYAGGWTPAYRQDPRVWGDPRY